MDHRGRHRGHDRGDEGDDAPADLGYPRTSGRSRAEQLELKLQHENYLRQIQQRRLGGEDEETIARRISHERIKRDLARRAADDDELYNDHGVASNRLQHDQNIDFGDCMEVDSGEEGDQSGTVYPVRNWLSRNLMLLRGRQDQEGSIEDEQQRRIEQAQKEGQTILYKKQIKAMEHRATKKGKSVQELMSNRQETKMHNYGIKKNIWQLNNSMFDRNNEEVEQEDDMVEAAPEAQQQLQQQQQQQQQQQLQQQQQQ